MLLFINTKYVPNEFSTKSWAAQKGWIGTGDSPPSQDLRGIILNLYEPCSKEAKALCLPTLLAVDLLENSAREVVDAQCMNLAQGEERNGQFQAAQ